MEEAQEKDMDAVASFKSGKSLTITGRQYNVCSQNQMINLLVSSNRYGYIFYATETDGLAIIPSAFIDRESRHLSKSSEDDDDDDDDNAENHNRGKYSIVRRSYIPGQLQNKTSSIIPCWISLNADETILALVLLQSDTKSWLIILYDVVKLIQTPDSTPMCPPLRLPEDAIDGAIQHFAWNPAIPNIFAYIDGKGSVSSFEVDQNSKQLKSLGRCNPNADNSSICWSPKGKQLVVVTYDGALELYDQNMTSKKKYSSIAENAAFPPCISVLWISTHHFLLGFSENNPGENTNDAFFHVLVSYEKDQTVKTQIYNDLFFDASKASPDINPQYFYARLNESKLVVCGLSKSLKINVLGADELNQNSLNIWSFADQYRAIVKSLANVNNERPILTGMAFGLNSTLSISEGNKKLPPCPMLLLSNSEGLLQVYYFIHKSLPSVCCTPEVIKPSLTNSSLETPLQALPFGPLQPTISAQQSSNGFSLANFISTPATNLTLQPRETSINSLSNSNQQSSNKSSLDDLSQSFGMSMFNKPTPVQQTSTQALSSNGTSFAMFPTTSSTPVISQPKETSSHSFSNFNQPPPNKSAIDDPSKSVNMIAFNKSIPVQQTPTKVTTNTEQSTANNKKLLQMIDEFQSKLKSLEKPLSKPSESSTNLEKSLENLITTLNSRTTSLQTSIQSLKSLTSEHIESMTKIEDARHQIKLSQKENLYHLLKDRELDPWTQSRLDSIKNKYDQLKHDLNVLLQLTHTTIHDRSLSINDDETENEDFLPDLEISLSSDKTMKQRLQKRILELSHKVSETERDLQNICAKLNTDILSSKTSDSTFTKTTMSSNRPFHSLDAQILSHLQATHKNVLQIRVPPAAVITLSSSTIEQKKPSTIETTKPVTPSTQPSTPKQPNSPSVESESFKNMLRIVRTSIDLFSGAISPEQVQELSNTIATSPLSSSTQKSNVASINKTPTIPKTTNLSKTSTITKPSNTTNIIQTPAKSTSSPIPTISIIPATPATQTSSLDALSKLQTNKPITQTATDLSKSQVIPTSGDGVIRSLLNNTVSPSAPMTSIPSQPIVTSSPNQVARPSLFGNAPSASTAQVLSQPPLPTTTATAAPAPIPAPVASIPSSIQSPFGTPLSLASTITTSVQSTSPTTKPVMSTGGFSPFGSRPTLGGAALNLTPTASSNIPFGGTPTTATTSTTPLFGSTVATTASVPAPFGSGFGTPASTASSTGAFSTATTSTSSPFGTGFGTPASTTSSAGGFSTATTSSSNMFGGGFGSTTTTAAATTPTPSTGLFGAGSAGTSPFGSSFNAAVSTSTPSPFGGGFGAISSAPTSSAFGAAPSLATPASSASVFGGTGFGFTSTLPATSTATSTAGTSVFGGNTATFGTGFSGFGTQSGSSGLSTGFSFGGFGAQPSEATAPQSTFGSFGSPPAASQPPSPFGAAIFGGASAQPTGFGAAASSFGASSTQSASPSFTTYRK